MKRIIRKKFFKWALLIGWMAIIFIFSHQPGEVSSEQSKLVIYVFNALGINLDSALGELSTFVVRKVAHFTEYFILGVLTYNAVKSEFKLKPALVLSMVVVFLYASVDEFHQSFIPGRGPAFRDVIIDTSGGVISAVVICFFVTFKKSRSN